MTAVYVYGVVPLFAVYGVVPLFAFR